MGQPLKLQHWQREATYGVTCWADYLNYGDTAISGGGPNVPGHWAIETNHIRYYVEATTAFPFNNPAYDDQNVIGGRGFFARSGSVADRWASYLLQQDLVNHLPRTDGLGEMWFSCLVKFLPSNEDGTLSIQLSDSTSTGWGAQGTAYHFFGLRVVSGVPTLVIRNTDGSFDTSARTFAFDMPVLLIARAVFNDTANAELSVWAFKASDTFGLTVASLGTPHLTKTTTNGTRLRSVRFGQGTPPAWQITGFRLSEDSGDRGLAAVLKPKRYTNYRPGRLTVWEAPASTKVMAGLGEPQIDGENLRQRWGLTSNALATTSTADPELNNSASGNPCFRDSNWSETYVPGDIGDSADTTRHYHLPVVSRVGTMDVDGISFHIGNAAGPPRSCKVRIRYKTDDGIWAASNEILVDWEGTQEVSWRELGIENVTSVTWQIYIFDVRDSSGTYNSASTIIVDDIAIWGGKAKNQLLWLTGFHRVNFGTWNGLTMSANTQGDRRSGIATSFNKAILLKPAESIEVTFNWSGGGSNNSARQIRWGFFNGSPVAHDGQKTLVSARYWRIYVVTNDTAAARLRTFTLRDGSLTTTTPANMTDNSTPSPYVASTNATEADAYKPFDGTTSHIELGDGEYVAIDLGAAYTAAVGDLVWEDTAGRLPLNYRLEYSGDGTSWEELYTYDSTTERDEPSPSAHSFGLDDTTRDWVGFGQFMPTRSGAGTPAAAVFYQGPGRQELMQYAIDVVTRLNGRQLITANQVQGIGQTQLLPVRLRLTRMFDDVFVVEVFYQNAGRPVATRSGSTVDNLLRWHAHDTPDGLYVYEGLFFGFDNIPFSAFAVVARSTFTMNNLKIRHRKHPCPLNINFGPMTRSTNSPAHAEGAIPLSEDQWIGTSASTSDVYDIDRRFYASTGLRRGVARTNGYTYSDDVTWNQGSFLYTRTSEVTGTGIFENNLLTQTFMNYSRVTNSEARPVGAVYRGLPKGVYDVYVVAHNNNSILDIEAAGLDDDVLVVGVGVTQDAVDGTNPAYTPNDTNLTWVPLEVVPDDSAWIEGDNYAKVRVTVTDQAADWLYVVVHYSHALSFTYRVAGLTMLQIVKVG